MTKIDCWESLNCDIQHKVCDAVSLPQRAHSHHVLVTQDDNLPYADPKHQYHISTSQRYPLDIGHFLQEHNTDPALKVSGVNHDTMACKTPSYILEFL